MFLQSIQLSAVNAIIYIQVQMTERSICFPNNRLTSILNYLPTLSGAQKEKILEPLRLPRALKIVY